MGEMMGKSFGMLSEKISWSVNNFDNKIDTEVCISIFKKCNKRDVLKALVFVFVDMLMHTKF